MIRRLQSEVSQEYHGAASSPEMELLATVIGKVPMMAVIAMASAEGTDILLLLRGNLSGFQENGLLRFVMMTYVFLSGVSIASVSYACSYLSEEWDEIVILPGLVHGQLTQPQVTVIGGVGGHYDHEMNVYNLYLQRLAHSGDDVTKDQHQKLMEEMVTAAVSILLFASPPTEQEELALAPFKGNLRDRLHKFPALRVVQRVYALQEELIHVVLLGGVAMATVATLLPNLQRDLKPSSSSLVRSLHLVVPLLVIVTTGIIIAGTDGHSITTTIAMLEMMMMMMMMMIEIPDMMMTEMMVERMMTERMVVMMMVVLRMLLVKIMFLLLVIVMDMVMVMMLLMMII
ncbi:hypothetical protein AK812_SmicGene18314 [Symbiodinium microadriaticum]|uniref:Uncharacterized protein n=1 Tax=Symbiodinium microadriaticum TaxID=2951 RepID=A0A1Q9DVG3_SYMMI|nr:hypothetical protein AK812_SmicGene18314 [Symbiodinium microadriaticum]